MPRNKVRSAFTVAVTAAVLVPVVVYGWRYAVDLSKQQACVRNLQVMGQACSMYQEDWHDVLVPYGAPFDWPPKGSMWPSLLHPYLTKGLPPDERGKAGKLWICPRRAEEETHWCYERSYGINERCGGWLPGEKPIVVPLKKVKHPGSTIRVAEMRWEAQGGSYCAAKPSDFISNDPTCHLFPEWHMGKGNVLWIDGHVSSMTQAQYNMRDKGPYDGNIWLRLEGPKPPVPGRRM